MNPKTVPHVFDLPDTKQSARLLAELGERFKVLTAPTRRLRVRYYDTFDWRLFRAGLELSRSEDNCDLRRLADGASLATARVTVEPARWEELPEGGLRDRLATVVAERVLQCVGELGLKIRDVRFLNKDEKTVVRARLQEGAALGRDGGTPVRMIVIQPVKGYAKEASRVARLLEGAGLTPAERTAFEVAVAAGGREPGDYTSKFEPRLNREMTAQQAASVILGGLAAAIERNVVGVREDVDTEFLHDFRVAIRRTRSALSLLTEVIPEEASREFRTRFADLGRATNRLRDLDVYLLARPAYRSMVQAEFRPALDAFFDELTVERTRQHSALVERLGGGEYRKLMRDWRETLAAFGTPALVAPLAGEPVESVVRRLVHERYEKVKGVGANITAESPDAELHRLRISCKKLRYLLEFFASLYPPKEIGSLVKQLKRLQDNLGEFNDLFVQRGELISFLHRSSGDTSLETAAAIGELVARLDMRRRTVRGEFEETFATFADRGTDKRIQRLFG